MQISDIQELVGLKPAERGLRFLEIGAELKKRQRKISGIGALPAPLQRESIMGTVVGEVIGRLYGIVGAAPHKMTGLSETGRDLKTKAGVFSDLVMTPRARKAVVDRAMARDKDRSINDLAIRQLAVGLCDNSPVARVCSAYAYWQATGTKDIALPILKGAIDSSDEEERMLAAHALRQVSGKRVSALEGTAEDDKPHSPVQPVKPSMTVIIHGTFAKNESWYQPGGDFHSYIKANVYSDVYSDPNDFFFWSGRYSLDDNGLRIVWRQAARKLVSWCQSHPAQKLRLIAHSHGNNVVNMATQMGLQNCTLIQLSPPVRTWNLPDMRQVSSDRFFNLHSRIDLVVVIDGGAQDYRGTTVGSAETRRKIAVFGHSESHEEKVWRRKNIPVLTRSVCLE